MISLPPGERRPDELTEMQELLRTAGVDTVAHARAAPAAGRDPRSYLGPGKLDELRELTVPGSTPR